MSAAGILIGIAVLALILAAGPLLIGRDARFDPGKHRVPRPKRPGWRGR